MCIEETERTEFSISELAREFEVTPRAIRFYEAEGLISPRRDGQRRIYTPRDRTRLKLTLRGKRLGLTLSEIRELIDMYEPGRDAMPGRSSSASWRCSNRTRRACCSSAPTSKRSLPRSRPSRNGSESRSSEVDVYVNVKYAPS